MFPFKVVYQVVYLDYALLNLVPVVAGFCCDEVGEHMFFKVAYAYGITKAFDYLFYQFDLIHFPYSLSDFLGLPLRLGVSSGVSVTIWVSILIGSTVGSGAGLL